MAWLKKHGGTFGHFIDGAFTAPEAPFATKNPATGAVLAEVSQGSAATVDAAVQAAARAFPKWSRTPGHARAKILYALARLVQKHSRLLAVLETMDNGKPIRESRDIDIPWSPATSITTRALPSFWPPKSPGCSPLASAARSSRGTSPC